MLLAEPFERTPLRARGRVASRRRAWPRSSSSSRASAPSCGAVGVVMLRNPFYSRARARLPPAVAGGAVPAAAGAVRRRRAGRRLRRRGDGALRLRRRLRRRPATGTLRARRSAAASARSRSLFGAGAVRRAGHRGARLGPEGASTPTAPTVRGRLRQPRADRRAAADEVPAPLRGRLVPAAHRRRRRRRARAPPRRHRRRRGRPRRASWTSGCPPGIGTMAEARRRPQHARARCELGAGRRPSRRGPGGDAEGGW